MSRNAAKKQTDAQTSDTGANSSAASATVENMYAPKEIFAKYVKGCEGKVKSPVWRTILLGIMAGAFIALGAVGSTVAMYGIDNTGISRTVGGCVFPIGLMLIMIIGGELFTGNCMLVAGVMERRYSMTRVAKNLLIVFVTNFIGAVLIAFLTVHSGQFAFSDYALGANVIKTAVAKANIEFPKALCSGILCNVLVCAGVYMGTGAKDMAGKIFAIFFPIFVFVTCGFEHCVANMYYISAGIFAKAQPACLDKAVELYGYTQPQIDSLNWGNMFVQNLLPVTLGNMIGGMLLVGLPAAILYRNKGK